MLVTSVPGSLVPGHVGMKRLQCAYKLCLLVTKVSSKSFTVCMHACNVSKSVSLKVSQMRPLVSKCLLVSEMSPCLSAKCPLKAPTRKLHNYVITDVASYFLTSMNPQKGSDPQLRVDDLRLQHHISATCDPQ